MNINETAFKYALKNAVEHGGKANINSVMGKVLAEVPEAKSRIKETAKMVKEVVEEVNSLSLEEQENLLSKYEFGVTIEKKEKKLPGLPNVEKYEKIRLRFSPNPSGPLHIGHARTVVLNDEFKKLYDGDFILRFEDTDPRRIDPSAYKMILEDIEWLDVKPDEIYYQSDRLEIYYKYARELLESRRAYVCLCKGEEIWSFQIKGIACPCRDLPDEEQFERWENMFNGNYREGDAVLRIKTDLNHPLIDVRDWSALRIVEHEHPRKKARVWPFMNFSVAIDDHLMKISHVLRGKDHERNTIKQIFIYDFFNWEKPEFIHHGKLTVEGISMSTSKVREGIEKGEYTGWDDPRLITLKSLRKRGFDPTALREFVIDFGVKDSDVSVSWKNLYSYNKKKIDPKAKRYFFVKDPVPLLISAEKKKESHMPIHPDRPEWGFRKYVLEPSDSTIKVMISKEDAVLLDVGTEIRLKDLMNVLIKGKDPLIADMTEDRLDIKKIQWISEGVPCKIYMPNGDISRGLCEKSCLDLEEGEVIQFERFGFVRIDKIDKEVIAYYSHP
ncbi:MAG: glutamate--tRNA ligase [Candidatus Hydrothermarchaeota archaeon]